jgi:Prophage tail length tape measure protein
MSRGVAKGMGITARATDEAVDSIVLATNISIDDAREITFAFVQTGTVTQNQLAKLGTSTVGLAQRTGKSVTDTGKEMAAALKYHH